MDDDSLRFISANEQDRAACDAWWKSTPFADKLVVWNYLQRDFADPVQEIVSRFAALAFAEAAERNKQ